VLREDSGSVKAIEMPYIDIIEMVCDHWAFSWVNGNLYEIFDWYEKNAERMLLHENTRDMYEEILVKIKNKLDA
jgi:hypothetical protein